MKAVVVGGLGFLGADVVRALRPKYRRIRTSVRPGLTGLWQVRGRGDADLDRLQALDTVYVHRRGLALDLWIVLRTIPIVLSCRRAY